jgi:hypothetical protein
VVLVDRVYSCSVSPYNEGYLLYLECKLYCFIIRIATMSILDVLGRLGACMCASSLSVSDQFYNKTGCSVQKLCISTVLSIAQVFDPPALTLIRS